MFRVTRAEEQALRLIMRLSATGQQQTLGELAESEALPEPTVAKLLGYLRRGGVVEAVRGRNGGYILADLPEKITAGQILGCINGDTSFEYPCGNPSLPSCPRNSDCGLRPIWRHLETRVAEVLNQTTVADLLKREKDAALGVDNLWPGPESSDVHDLGG
jgi:Rrf2 family protein